MLSGAYVYKRKARRGMESGTSNDPRPGRRRNTRPRCQCCRRRMPQSRQEIVSLLRLRIALQGGISCVCVCSERMAKLLREFRVRFAGAYDRGAAIFEPKSQVILLLRSRPVLKTIDTCSAHTLP